MRFERRNRLGHPLNVWRDSRPDLLTTGLAQLDDDMNGLSYHGSAVETG